MRGGPECGGGDLAYVAGPIQDYFTGTTLNITPLSTLIGRCLTPLSPVVLTLAPK